MWTVLVLTSPEALLLEVRVPAGVVLFVVVTVTVALSAAIAALLR